MSELNSPRCLLFSDRGRVHTLLLMPDPDSYDPHWSSGPGHEAHTLGIEALTQVL